MRYRIILNPAAGRGAQARAPIERTLTAMSVLMDAPEVSALPGRLIVISAADGTFA